MDETDSPLKDGSPTHAHSASAAAERSTPKSAGRLQQQQAELEWERVNALRQKAMEEKDLQPKLGIQPRSSFLISYEEALHCFLERDMTAEKGLIQVEVPAEGLAGKLRMVKPAPKLPAPLLPERDLVFCIAKCPFDDAVPDHLRILQTIYVRLTGDKLEPPRLGGHWELIGFQQNNPATDLRDMGMLSLVQLLFFVSKYTNAARIIHKLSRHEIRHFPFALVSINMTKIALQALRSGRMFKAAIRTGSLFNVFHHFYLGIFYEFYRRLPAPTPPRPAPSAPPRPAPPRHGVPSSISAVADGPDARLPIRAVRVAQAVAGRAAHDRQGRLRQDAAAGNRPPLLRQERVPSTGRCACAVSLARGRTVPRRTLGHAAVGNGDEALAACAPELQGGRRICGTNARAAAAP
jgi:hypothetical protein